MIVFYQHRGKNDTPDDFESKCIPEPNSGCWFWLGCLSLGYGVYRDRPAHRVSYELYNGPIPVGMVIDHKCETKCCVNPHHLQAVTSQENSLLHHRRMKAWGRQRVRVRKNQHREKKLVLTRGQVEYQERKRGYARRNFLLLSDLYAIESLVLSGASDLVPIELQGLIDKVLDTEWMSMAMDFYTKQPSWFDLFVFRGIELEGLMFWTRQAFFPMGKEKGQQ